MSKTVAIIGGHGQIALSLTGILHSRGDRVLSLVRNPEHSGEIEAAGGTPVVIDIENSGPREIADAIDGADSVVFAAGAGPGSSAERKVTVDLEGSVKSAEAATLARIPSFIQISFIGAELPTPEGTDPVFAAYWAAKREADRRLESTTLDWVIVKPGTLTNDPASGKGELGASLNRGARTRRADVAELIAHVIDEPRSARHTIGIAEGQTDLREALSAFVSI